MITMEQVIGIPLENDNGLESYVSGHFGKAPFYLLYNTSTKTASVIKNTSNHFGGKEHPPVLLKNAGVQIMLAGGMGANARKIFEKNNIKVYYGAINTAKETLELYETGKLTELPPDDGNHHHDHHHD